MLKSEKLMKLEEVGIFYQDRSNGPGRGKWYNGYKEDVDLTPMLRKAGMFEH